MALFIERIDETEVQGHVHNIIVLDYVKNWTN